MNVKGGRARIMRSLRRGLKRDEVSAEIRVQLTARLAEPKCNLVPARSDKTADARVALFTKMAESVQASVLRVPDASQVPNAIAHYLADNNLPSDFVMAPDKTLDVYPWTKCPLLNIRRGKAVDADQVSVTAAEMGFAETGTLMLTSDATRPSTLNFLPENHIVVLRANRIAGGYEEGWRLLRKNGGPNFMPRTVNMITGPSRTGDIEQTMQLGAHGPRRLHIIIVED